MAVTTDGGEPDASARLDRTALVFAAVVAALGVAALEAPAFLAKRFGTAPGDMASIVRVLRAAAPAWLAMAAAAAVMASGWAVRRPRTAGAALTLLVVGGYVSLTTCLSDWIIDDAAITFAYSKNLAAGHGLVIHPGHAPEEGYSNTLWMLMLAGAKVLGADIALTAKRAGVAFGAIAAALSFFVCDAVTGRQRRFGPLVLAMTVCVGAPFIVWSASGLEHSLQAAALVAVVAAPYWPRRQPVIMGIALSALVLTRPEAPLIVIAVATVLALRDRVTFFGLPVTTRRQWPALVLPAATWVSLVAFRFAYFHDPLTNPYYAKSYGSSVLRILNFAGGGWAYVFDWLADSRAWLVVPLLLLAPWRGAPLPYKLAAAISLAQLPFVLYFCSDWMECYRFISPVLPALAVVVVFAVTAGGRRWSRLSSTTTCLALAWFLGMGTIAQLIKFRTHPSTPTAIVAQIGETFVALGQRLGVEHVSLAAHDAGGTSYVADIDLVDLGGLGDRAVAKHMYDPAFMRTYLFEERRPTFFFGSSQVFTARGTRFFEMPEFAAYVRVRFPSRPYMEADLCHVRRDAIHAVPGVRQARDEAGDYWIVD